MLEQGPSPNTVVTPEEKQTIVEIIFELSHKFKMPEKSVTGLVTHFEQTEVNYTSIYVPGVMSEGDDPEMYYNAVTVIERESLGRSKGVEMVRTKSFVIHLSDLETDYNEEIYCFDAITGLRIPNPINASEGMDAVRANELDAIRASAGLKAGFNRDRYDELVQLLNFCAETGRVF